MESIRLRPVGNSEGISFFVRMLESGEFGLGMPAVAGRHRAWGAEARLAGGADCVACTGAKLRPGGVFFLSHLNQFCYVSTILILPKITDREGTGPANEEHHRLTGHVRIGKLDRDRKSVV